ncbi:hypothetical protein ANO11243_057030 [Dothideomycetidae sp. 11243]|nr:hypothetical protein ANO11243_057030 [fungal sp. No.11243]
MTVQDVVEESIWITGPSSTVDLAPLDTRHPEHYGCRLLVFECDTPERRNAQLTALKQGLEGLLQRCPILDGSVLANEDGQGRHITPGQGLELSVKDLSASIPSFSTLKTTHFPPSSLPAKLLNPAPLDVSGSQPYPTCKVQYTLIDGGILLSFAFSHVVTDGAGADEILRVLSLSTRNSYDPAHAPTTTETIGLDRTLLRNITSPIAFDIAQHKAYVLDPATASPAESPHPFRASTPEIPVLIRISKDNLSLLKADATPDSGFVSSHDALAALMWRSVFHIRAHRSSSAVALLPTTEAKFFMPSDARRHLGLDRAYVGNAVYQLTASLSAATLLSDAGLRTAAAAIRAAITDVKPELVESYMQELKRRWIGWGFMQNYDTTGFGMGSGWTSTELYEWDWGDAFGRVASYRFPGSEGADNYILPKRLDGSAEVVVSVMPEEVHLLEAEDMFGKYGQVVR